ncbi:hypothetical protein BD311DRAFT_782124 [Dichomitus squalens]|uniref:Uncharacterized protein n=1 Tax=Dichomitus squalens TaxID=114155 RepID=A0A4Q9M9E3_9APHY|nr:hypothetical protein BD311DRAFT_782124 [Dichomitus squalens]TBU54302.1 hypothetical protein BD310DRAFT_828345 [Dichomitus squalens]
MSNTRTDNTNRTTGDDTHAHGAKTQKLKGATELVHGLGESIRGRFMEAVDGSQGSRHAPISQQGRQEVERGMAKLTGGPGAASVTSSTGTRNPNPAGDSDGVSTNTESSSGFGARQRANGGNALGPSSGLTTGFGNAGPEAAVAQAPYGGQESAMGQQGSTNRDFGYEEGHTRRDPAVMGQQGNSPGPAPDRYTLSGEPKRLG